MTRASPIEILPATGAHWDALAELFATARSMSGCWCMWPRLERGTHRPDDPQNRDAMQALINGPEPPGLIAYLSGRPAGWCALGPRARYAQYAGPAGTDVWAIACVFVAERARGVGVARALVEFAVGYAFERGAHSVDGPPPWWRPEGEEASAAAKGVFLACGFKEIGPGRRMPELRIETGRSHD